MLLAIVSAFLYLLSFPLTRYDISLWPLVFISLAPLFLSLDRTEETLVQCARGAVWGAIMSLGMGYWLLYAAIWQYGTSVMAAVIFMIAGLALPHALLYGAFGLLYGLLKQDRLRFYILAVPSLWVVMEYMRELVPLLVPWGLAGYAPYHWNTIMQMADVTGIYGLSFMVVMINGALAFLCRGISLSDAVSSVRAALSPGRLRDSVMENRRVLAVLACALFVPAAYGAVRGMMVRSDMARALAAGQGVPITIVQPNFTQDERWKDAGFMDRVNICIGLTGRCPAAGGVIVWPETVLNSQGMVGSGLFSMIRSRMGDARLLIAGGVRRSIGTRGVYNTAYLVSGKEGETFYDKNVLLPYAESSPFGPLFGSFYTAPAEFLQGETPQAALADVGTAGLSICFESVYPWHTRRAVASGARFLVNISNEGWFGRSSEPPLHLRQASVRAIENRRFMVRASNNGYSAVISPAGEMISLSGLFTRQCVTGTIVMMESKSLYTILGDWVLYAAAALLLVMLAATLFRK